MAYAKASGKEFVSVVKDKGNGWRDDKLKNPTNNKVENKTAYVLCSGDSFVMTWIYK